MHVYLETDRLILRRATMDDVDDLVALYADPEVMRYMNGGDPTPRQVIAEVRLPAWLADYERGGEYGSWIMVERATSAFLGRIHFRPDDGDADGEPNLGYLLRRSAWGKGYATEIAVALIDKAFGELGASRVLSSAYGENARSRRVMEKAGMRLIRTYRLTPEEVVRFGYGDPATFDDIFPGDEVEYAITREEWERSKARQS